jgi:hypothetical protein
MAEEWQPRRHRDAEGDSQGRQSPQALERFIGTWKQNIAKSKYSPGPGPKSQTVVIKVSEGGLLATGDFVNAQGQHQQNQVEIPEKFDGKDYPVKAAPQPATRSFKWIDDSTMEGVTKVNGKQTATTRASLSRVGKIQTLTTTGTNAQGQNFQNVVVLEKQ